MGFLDSLFGVKKDVPQAESKKPESVSAAAGFAPTPVQTSTSGTPVRAPMPGKISKVIVKEGQQVKMGDPVIMLEAMKMQNEIISPVNGVIKSIDVSAGQAVKAGAVMAVIA